MSKSLMNLYWVNYLLSLSSFLSSWGSVQTAAKWLTFWFCRVPCSTLSLCWTGASDCLRNSYSISESFVRPHVKCFHWSLKTGSIRHFKLLWWHPAHSIYAFRPVLLLCYTLPSFGRIVFCLLEITSTGCYLLAPQTLRSLFVNRKNSSNIDSDYKLSLKEFQARNLYHLQMLLEARLWKIHRRQ